MRTWNLPDGVKAASVNGYDMAYVERGAGVPVVFVHGAGGDYRSFAAQMEPFAATHRAIAVSLRRYFPEPWRGEGEFSLAQQAADLVAFIRHLDAGQAHLVGHSRGATVALYAATAAPQLVRSLTFAEGGGGMKAFSPDDPAQRERRDAAFAAMGARLAGGDADGALEIFANYVNGPGGWAATPEATRQAFRDNAWTFPAAAADEARWPALGCAELARLAIPTLLLGGDRSPANFGQMLDKFQRCLRHAERGIVADSGHSMPRMNPAGFHAAVRAFIAKH